MNIKKILPWITALTMIIAICFVFHPASAVYGPGSEPLGNYYKIFYFHVPLAWVAYLAFFVVFISSIRYLQKGGQKWDIFALSSAEIGVIFCGLVLVTGMIWAKATWGVYWIWDPRLTTSLVLWLLYAAYLMLRSAIPEPERKARLASVFGIIAFVGAPLSYFSIHLWSTIHPEVVTSGGIKGHFIISALLINLIAFTLLYVYLFLLRVEIEMMHIDA
ncbi:MAG: cytochrome c biogenesis protein CcsA [Methanosarcinales archaeon]|nr:MAG: cytochrome c biogenesis protein CcsA [Methanosarcinales archaeon]